MSESEIKCHTCKRPEDIYNKARSSWASRSGIILQPNGKRVTVAVKDLNKQEL